MNTTWTIAGQLPEKQKNIHITFINSYRLTRVLTRCDTVTLRVVLFLRRYLCPHRIHVQLKGFGDQIFKSMLG